MMKPTTLYSEDIWERYCLKIARSEKEYKLKTYPQLDPPFNFFKKKALIKSKVCDPTLRTVATHAFLPFIKILTKTPRYRFQESEGEYQLETKTRPISFAAHMDTYLYGFYSFALTEKYQEYIKKQGFDACVLAYRTDLNGKCNIQFAKEAFDYIKQKLNEDEECTALAFDISSYFDNIHHRKLKEKWCKILEVPELPVDQYQVYRSLTSYSYVGKDSFLKHFKINTAKTKKNWFCLLDLLSNDIAGPKMLDKLDYLRSKNLIVTNVPKIDDQGNKSFRGIPQGSSMSALLSNIYLIDFDEWLNQLANQQNFMYKRYCDDILIICKTEIADQLAVDVVSKIREYDLVIQSRKTEIIRFQQNSQGKVRGFNIAKLRKYQATLSPDNEHRYYKNLQYLGFEFSGQTIYIRPGSLSRYFRKMKSRIVKTISMAYSKQSRINYIQKKQLYERYSHIGRRNFLSYAYKAASKTYLNSQKTRRDGLDSPSIRKQISAHFAIIEQQIINKSEDRFNVKESQMIARKNKGKRAKAVRYKI